MRAIALNTIINIINLISNICLLNLCVYDESWRNNSDDKCHTLGKCQLLKKSKIINTLVPTIGVRSRDAGYAMAIRYPLRVCGVGLFFTF